MNQINSLPKNINELLFVFSVYCQLLDLPLNMVQIPNETLLEKTSFFFSRIYQLEIAFKLVMRAYVALSQCRKPVGLKTVQACGFTYTPVLLCLEGLVFLVSSIASGSQNLFASFFCSFLSSEGKHLMQTSHLGWDVPRSLTLIGSACLQVKINGFMLQWFYGSIEHRMFNT